MKIKERNEINQQYKKLVLWSEDLGFKVIDPEKGDLAVILEHIDTEEYIPIYDMVHWDGVLSGIELQRQIYDKEYDKQNTPHRINCENTLVSDISHIVDED